jgi:hypothetical protein
MTEEKHECDKCSKTPQTPPKFRINRDCLGGVEVEAPNKEDCLELYNQVTSQPTKAKIDQAIR